MIDGDIHKLSENEFVRDRHRVKRDNLINTVPCDMRLTVQDRM